MRPGSAGAMKTPTACCANSSQKGPICQRSARRSSMISPDTSRTVRARPWIGRHPRKSWRRKLKHSQNVLHLILETSQHQQKERALHTVFESAQALTELKELDSLLLNIAERGRKLLGSDLA